MDALSLPIKKMSVGLDELEIFKTTQGEKVIAPLSCCEKVLRELNIHSKINCERSDQGGNGIVFYTEDDQYAIKRSVVNENRLLQKNADLITKCHPRGFSLNLPRGLYDLYVPSFHAMMSDMQLDCSVQVFEKVKPLSYRQVVDWSICGYFNDRCQEQDLDIIKSLGKQLALFQQSNGLKLNTSGEHYLGLQHGDFNSGNIFITKFQDKEASFTLIDNADFSKEGRIISDLVYFIYFTTYGFKNFEIKGVTGTQQKEEKLKLGMTAIINALYQGYVGNLPREACDLLKKNVFANMKTSPLECAEAKVSRRPYPKPFNNPPMPHSQKPWSTFFEPCQIEAFTKAYNGKYAVVAPK